MNNTTHNSDAVYAARTLYNAINHTAFFDDDQICSAVATFKKEQAKKLPQADVTIKMSPNPTNSLVDILIKGSKEDLQMTIYNNMGQIVGQATVNNYIELDVSSFNSGIYQVCFIATNGNTFNSRLIVTK